MRCVALPLLAPLLLLGCGKDGQSTNDGPAESVVAVANPAVTTHYSGRVDIDPAAGALTADLTVRTDRTGADHVDFVLSGPLRITEISGPRVTGYAAEPMQPGAAWDRVRVALEPGVAGEPTEIRFRYQGTPALPESRINSIDPGWVELSVDSAWHPIVATFTEEATIEILVGLPADWTVVAPGTVTRTGDGFTIHNDVPHGDIVFTAAPALDVAESEGNHLYHRGASAETVEAVLAAAATCRSYLDGRFGAERRLPDTRFTLPDREESGYARKNYIALTRVDDSTPENLTGFLCHELAHFWSSGAAWDTVDNWLNESFAVLVAAQAVREEFGEESWHEVVEGWEERSQGQGSIWTPDNLERRPFEINYKKGPLALARLEDEIGPAAFERWVVRYMTDPIDDTPALLDALEEEAGPAARRWFEAVLAGDDREPATE